MDKNIIKRNFSKNAASYDAYSSVQKKCAKKLISLMGQDSFSRILEMGCGTGTYTALLRAMYPGASIVASDISEEMIKIARSKNPGNEVIFETIDSETSVPNGKFDLITSNAVFQWFRSFERALINFMESLERGGTLCFSMYGSKTFYELTDVLVHTFGGTSRITTSRFPSYEIIKNTLRTYFRDFELTEEYFTRDFASLWDFLSDIRHSGARGEGLKPNIFMGKRRLEEMERVYIEKFGRIRATHHVYFCRAVYNGD